MKRNGELKMNIREVCNADAQDIYDLYLKVMNYNYPVNKIEEMIRIVNKDHCNYVFVAVEHSQVIGVIEVVIKYSIHKDSYLIINTLAVLSKYQGQGIGSQLLNYVEEFSKKMGLSSITLGSQFKREKAHHFYLSHDYQIIKEHKIFEKTLNKNWKRESID